MNPTKTISCVVSLWIFIVALCNGQFVSFKKPTGVKVAPVVIAIKTLSMNENKWYASWPTAYRLYLIGRFEFQYTLNCMVNQLENEDVLTGMDFCFEGAACQTMTTKESRSYSPRTSLSVTLDYNPIYGGEVKFGIMSHDVDASFTFHCVARNRRGALKSNTVEVIDKRREFPSDSMQLVPRPSGPLHKDGPISFPCTDKRINLPEGVRLRYEWKYCGTIGNQAVNPAGRAMTDQGLCSPVKLSSLTNDNSWPYQIQPDGTLFIPYFTDEIAAKLNKEQLICYINNNPITMFKNQIQFTDAPSSSKITVPKITRPNSPSENVKLYNVNEMIYILPCNFKVGKGEYNIIWSYQPASGGKLIDLVNGMNPKQKVFVMQNILTFRGPFTKDTPGKYTCTVNWTPTGGSMQQKSSYYNIDLMVFPTVSAEVAPKQFVVDGSNGTVECLYDNIFPPSQKNDMAVKPGLGINGRDINMESQEKLDSSVLSVNTEFTTTMNPLKVAVSPMNPKAGQNFTYSAKNMKINMLAGGLTSSHQVQCKGSNILGSVEKSVTLTVVPKPLLDRENRPSKLNCSSECSAAVDHTLRCVIKNKDEYKKYEVDFKQTWKIGETPIDLLKGASKYLHQNDENATLLIKKIDDKNVKEEINKGKKIACVVTLSYRKGVQLPVALKAQFGGVFYSSETDSSMRTEYVAMIKLTKIAPPIQAAGAMWIIPVAMACIVILICIALIVVCCRKKGVGETYNVDEKEKQQGNDPEAENAEKEAFPIFERPEDGPIRGSRASLDDSIQVGSDDEDEVLAEYDVDIGKFDEEGSFIGQYATNDSGAPPQPGPRRLPQVGNNTEI